MKKGLIILLVVIFNVVLGASLVAIYFTTFNQNGNDEEAWTLTIKGDVEQEVILKIEDLESMPNITRDYIVQGTPTFTAEYIGVSLFYLVTEIANITVAATIQVISIDLFSNSLTLDEINATRDIIIAHKKDGNNITSHSDGGEGPLRLIIPQKFEGEYNGQYCVKFITEIKITLL
ncbi:MAG: molybdopterin-dependent oxidoreductase [Candidatus Heimdallarchaeota archaeon]